MTDLPPAEPDDDRAPVIADPLRLIAMMRAGHEASTRRLYRRVFGSPEGSAVLADILARNGHGAVRGLGMSGEDRAYNDGRCDAAVEILNTAGFDQPSAVLLLMTETLEGQQDDGRDADPDAWTDPDAEPDT